MSLLNKNKLPKLIVILGPTSSGKTALAIKLAKKFNGEIISADSRQIYKEMDIGTAKPVIEKRITKSNISKSIIKNVSHYLINVIKPNQKFNVAVYKIRALKIIRKILNRRKIPFLVGGTGLYIKAVVNNINFPKIPAQKELRGKLELKNTEGLFEIYKKLDSRGAKFIDKKNKRRLIRAIEVCKITKKSFWAQRRRGEKIFNTLQVGIKLPKQELERKINSRVEQMFVMGLEQEVKKLTKKYGFKISPMQTIGYQEWQDFFDKKITKKEVKKRINLHTFQFARRQMTWFKKDKRIKWISSQREAETLIKNFLSKK